MPAFAVNQCYQESFSYTAINSITLPVTDAIAVAYFFGPLRDDPVRLNAVIVGISGLNTLSTASEILFCSDFRELSQSYVPIDCRYTEGLALRKFLMPASANCLR